VLPHLHIARKIHIACLKFCLRAAGFGAGLRASICYAGITKQPKILKNTL